MINETYKAMLGGKSVIRTLSEYATARGTEIGYDNVFDYSLGNPSVPCPSSFTKAMIDMYETADPVALHGYSPSLGNPEACRTIAESLNRRFGMDYTAGHIFPTTGAAGALAHALRAVTKPGDEVLTFAPYFPEYHPYVEGAGARLTVVPADIERFQLNFAAFEAALNPEVAVVLINTPNNPSGAVYSAETLDRLAGILRAKQAEYGHDIFLISDEPYREIVFDGGYVDDPGLFNPDAETRRRDRYTLVYQPEDDSLRVARAKRDAMCLKFLNKVHSIREFREAMRTLAAEQFLWCDIFVSNTYLIPLTEEFPAVAEVRSAREIYDEWLGFWREFV